MASEASRSVRNEAQPARRSGKSIVYSKHSNPLNILLKAPGDQFEASKIVWISVCGEIQLQIFLPVYGKPEMQAGNPLRESQFSLGFTSVEYETHTDWPPSPGSSVLSHLVINLTANSTKYPVFILAKRTPNAEFKHIPTTVF